MSDERKKFLATLGPPDFGRCRYCGVGIQKHESGVNGEAYCQPWDLQARAGASIALAAEEYSVVKDSGERQKFDTGSVRDTREGKGRYDLIPEMCEERLARHYENGAKKYGDRNWEKGQPLSRYWDSARRHLAKVKLGLKDEDHAAAVVWNVYAIMWTVQEIELGHLPAELDDLRLTTRGRGGDRGLSLDNNRKEAR